LFVARSKTVVTYLLQDLSVHSIQWIKNNPTLKAITVIHDSSVSVSWLFTLCFGQKSNEVINRFSYGDSV